MNRENCKRDALEQVRMNGIQCKEELDLDKNINTKSGKKVKGYVCVYTAILVEEKYESSLYFPK